MPPTETELLERGAPRRATGRDEPSALRPCLGAVDALDRPLCVEGDGEKSRPIFATCWSFGAARSNFVDRHSASHSLRAQRLR
jgi:hypothetical protein